MPGKYPCVCCGHLTLLELPGSYGICPVCFWEDDLSELIWPNGGGGANGTPLTQAQWNFVKFGACEQRLLRHVRPPDDDEPREPGWRPIDMQHDKAFFRRHSRNQDLSDNTSWYWWRSEPTAD